MSLKEKVRSLARLPYVTRLVDQIKSSSKKHLTLVAAGAAALIISAAGLGLSSSAGEVKALNNSPLPTALEYSADKNAVTALLSGNLVPVYGGSFELKSAAEKVGEVNVSRITLSLNEKSFTFTDLKSQLKLTPMLSSEIDDAAYIWKSEDEKIAAVDENGTVTPKKNGTVNIICTEKTSGASAKCEITVDTTEVESLKLGNEELELTLKESKTIKTEIGPSDAANKSLKWSSSDESVAKVDSKGKVTAVSAGQAVITCATTDGSDIKKECKVTVEDRVKLTQIELNYIDIKFYGLGSVETLEVLEYVPSDATDTSVTWSSTDENVAVVDSNGNVSPVGNGDCEIIATANDGSKVTASCPVDVSGVENYVTVTNTYEVTVPVNVDVNETAASVVEEADKYVGWLPYVWGGTDLTSGVDCSGFVCAIYEKFGYNLWGIRTDLINAGREVSLEEARAGDIIVYNGHVAIYDGAGGKIHAPQTGYMVTHDYGIGNYRSIRRVIE